ncbi:hypothetical protein VTO42DRAFT_1400 [Malbranchea cinnamomea]
MSDLDAIRRWLDQSKYDPSVSDFALAKFENNLRSILDVHTRRLNLAALYSRLLIEWLGSLKSGDEQAPLEDPDEDFEVVQSIQKKRLEQLRERSGKIVFGPLFTDQEEINRYLSSLFEGVDGAKAITKLRQGSQKAGTNLLQQKQPFDREELKHCVRSLLKNDLLNQEKQASLRDFLRDDTVLDDDQGCLKCAIRTHPKLDVECNKRNTCSSGSLLHGHLCRTRDLD